MSRRGHLTAAVVATAMVVMAACGGAAADGAGEPERVTIVAPADGEATPTTAADPDDFSTIDIADGPRVCEAITSLVTDLEGAPGALDGAGFTRAAGQSRDLAANAPEPLSGTLRQIAAGYTAYAALADEAGWTPLFGTGTDLEGDAVVLLAWTEALDARDDAADLQVLAAVGEARSWLAANCVG
ncbi:MAG: hypothetical protein ACXIVQ_11325 [Acidimicrobiales bacterium]